MNRSTKIYLPAICGILLAVLSCSREEPSPTARADASTRLEMQATIGQMGTVSGPSQSGTKSAVIGTSFPNGGTMGLFITRADRPGQYEPHLKGMNNMRATWRTPDGWSYSFSHNLTLSVGQLAITSITKDEGGNVVHADIFAYAPWIEGVTSPEDIHVDMSLQNDIMYAEENASADATSKDIAPEDENDHTVSLHFRHALSLLRVGVRLAREGYKAPYLSSVTLRKTSDGVDTKLYSSARFNAVSGTIVGGTEGETSEVSLVNPDFGGTNNNSDVRVYITSTTDYTYGNLLLLPTEVMNDDDLELAISINGEPLLNTYPIKKASVTHSSDPAAVGFQSGCQYEFLFTIDNYLRLEPDGVFISEEWADTTIVRNI